MKKLLVVLLLISILGCNQENTSSLKNDPIVNEYFNKEEIQDLDKLLKFFESEITTSSDNINDLYSDFFSSLDIQGRNEIIPFEKQYKIFKNISPELFDKIWFYEQVYIPNLNDSVQTIYFKYGGEYFEFLYSISQKDKSMEDYYNEFMMLFDADPTLLAYYTRDYKKYNFEIERNRLIIAITYLHYNEYLRLDSIKRKK